MVCRSVTCALIFILATRSSSKRWRNDFSKSELVRSISSRRCKLASDCKRICCSERSVRLGSDSARVTHVLVAVSFNFDSVLYCPAAGILRRFQSRIGFHNQNPRSKLDWPGLRALAIARAGAARPSPFVADCSDCISLPGLHSFARCVARKRNFGQVKAADFYLGWPGGIAARNH